jgi:dihydrofolate reductase
MSCAVFIATSLDGYIARPDGALDWLPEDGGEPHGYDAFLASVDALVIGRGTYETVLGFAAWPYGTKPVVVLSTGTGPFTPPTGAVCERLAGEPGEVVASLGQRGWRSLYIDGGITIQRFLRAGLIDRLILTRVPVLLGCGIPLFGPLPGDLRLVHVATRAYASGLVQSEYHRPS